MAMSAALRTVLLLVVCIAAVSAAPRYQNEIPAIPANYAGVGHVNPTGGGARNDFGKAFAAAGHTWTKDLCQADSDGDGATNGAELGDPNCNWKKGMPQRSGAKITHPGLASSKPSN